MKEKSPAEGKVKGIKQFYAFFYINDENKIKWEVRDSGIGISRESRKEIFEKFKRSKNANIMNCDGAGLGLFIIKKLVDAHPDGEAGFESGEDEGSTFWVKFAAV